MSGCLFKLSDERYVKVVNRRGEWKIEIATFKGKKGIRLTTSQYQIFTEIVGDIEKSKGYDTKHHLGLGVYISTPRNKSRVDIWEHCENGRKGLSLKPCEFETLKTLSDDINTYLYDVQTPCFMTDSHQNQLGMMQCPACNGQEYEMWL